MPRLHHVLRDSTERTYASRRAALGLDGLAAADVVRVFSDFLRENPPIGTALPTRAAALRALVEQGLTQRDAEDLLPSVTGLKAGSLRFALSADQLSAYYAAVWRMPAGSVRTALYLFPQTGLRTEEMCTLMRAGVRPTPKGFALEIFGKSKQARLVHVRQSGAAMLAEHLARVPHDTWIFPASEANEGPLRASVLQTALAGYTNRGKHYPGLGAELNIPGLTPYALRHTFATQLLERGVALPVISKMLGHESTRTTSEYLHIADVAVDAAFDTVSR